MKSNKILAFFVEFILVPACYVILAFLLVPVILFLFDMMTSTEPVPIKTDKTEQTSGPAESAQSIDKNDVHTIEITLPPFSPLDTRSIPEPLEQVSITPEPVEPREKKSSLPDIQSCGRPWSTPLSEIQGEIKKVEYRTQPGTGLRGLHLDVQTAKEESVVIHVFPERLARQCSDLFQFNPGEVVTVSGSEFLTKAGKQKNICAAKISRDSGTLNVRDVTTGHLDREECCKRMCQRNCAGKPSVCGEICMNTCTNIF